MRTIAICNNKGGVAKTTTAINIAAILARDHKQRVLLVDADSQCNVTDFYGADLDSYGTVADLLRSKGPVRSKDLLWYIQPTAIEGVDLIAADDSLMDLDLTAVRVGDAQAAVLRDTLRGLAVYDWVLIDCPPAFNAASSAALLAADEVLIPVKLDRFAVRGMTNLMRQIVNMRQINPGLRLAGCLLSVWHSTPDIDAAEQTLRDSGLPILGRIRRSDQVDGKSFGGDPLIYSSPRSAATVDYRRFVRKLMEEGRGNG